MLFATVLMTAALAFGSAWAADSPEAQVVTLEPMVTAYGELGLQLTWNCLGPELRAGKGWITLGEVVRVPATIERTGTLGALVRSDHPFLVRELGEAIRPLFCGGEVSPRAEGAGPLCHEVRWEAAPKQITVVENELLDDVRAAVCGESTWDTIPGGTPIQDIDGFLATCPPAEELAILERDFPILFQPPRRTRDPVYSCAEPPASMRELSDQLAIYQALRVIRHMRLSAPLPWTSLHPYDWLKSKIGAIVVSHTAKYSHCCIRVLPLGRTEPAIAIVLQKAAQELLRYRTVWRDPRSGVGLAHLILLIFHEARHVDLPHDCGDKDSTLSYMGAWGVQYTLAKMLSEGTIDVGLSPAYREDMAFHAQELLATRFCEGK